MHRESKISVGSIVFSLNLSDVMWKPTTGFQNNDWVFTDLDSPNDSTQRIAEYAFLLGAKMKLAQHFLTIKSFI